MLPFPSQIKFLPGESRYFLTENFTDFSFNVMQKSGEFWTKISPVRSCKKKSWSQFGNFGIELRFLSGKRRYVRSLLIKNTRMGELRWSQHHVLMLDSCR